VLARDRQEGASPSGVIGRDATAASVRSDLTAPKRSQLGNAQSVARTATKTLEKMPARAMRRVSCGGARRPGAKRRSLGDAGQGRRTDEPLSSLDPRDLRHPEVR
jgi:hypothetical protein